MDFEFGTIILIDFPFSDNSTSKLRPVVVIKDTQDGDIIVAKITSQDKNQHFDLPIDYKAAGLLKPSVIRTHKIASLSKEIIYTTLGNLTTDDKNNLQKILFKLFNNL